MKTMFQVHSAEQQAFEVEAQVLGQTVTALVQGLVVELVSLDGVTSMKRVFYRNPAETEEAIAFYKVGHVIESVDTDVSDPDDIAIAAPIQEAALAQIETLKVEREAIIAEAQAADAAAVEG